MVPFGQNLRAWRASRQMTQEALATKSGIPRPNLVSLEQGRRECNLSTLYRLAYALGVSPGRLIDETPSRKEVRILDRHEVDTLARNLLTGKGKLSPTLIALKKRVAFEAGPLLRVAGAPKIPKSRPRGAVPSVEVDRVLERVRKLVASQLSGGSDEKR